jgi:hypothetical protein
MNTFKNCSVSALLSLGFLCLTSELKGSLQLDTGERSVQPEATGGSGINENIPEIKYSLFSLGNKGNLFVDNDTIVFCQISFLGPDGKVIQSVATAEMVSLLPAVIRDMVVKLGVGGRGFAIVPYETFFEGGKGDPSLPFGEEVRLDLEVRDSIPSGKALEANSSEVGIIVIDMDQNGIAETLRGGDWEKMPKDDRWLDRNYTREIKLMGNAEHREWIGPNTGVLLTERRVGEVSLEDLVGTHTGGAKWDSGYDVLSQYDRNQNEILMGKELDSLFVWVDRNSNAMIDDDEITPAGELFSIITLRPSSLTGNKARRTDGVKFKDETKAGTWEWTTRGSQIP